ncbi:ABA-INDUCED expression 1 [Hibiscus trionum]|uniref:ABA-INDUCED expression 1 n=1 Tax=Hibiscus trionum TaxID=183268 RepID=A0A9W7GVL6_HIBTR|nr:ABA-INDUCED expression 1 [Hibiscus trionum]
MEEQIKLKPNWLMPLVDSPCETHASKYVFFCLDCMGSVLCEECLRSKEHPSHQILQVYKASHQVVIKTNGLHKLMDISCIQPYINNDTKVLYINQRRQKDAQPNSIIKCQTCGWQLLPGAASRFCSIECKINDEGIQIEKTPHSYRRKSRKGVPRRSPFF